MNKIGKFRGISVYRTDASEWRHTDTKNSEALYVIEGKVYYHDEQIGRIDAGGELADFDEYLFNHLKTIYQTSTQKVTEYREKEAVAQTTSVTETRAENSKPAAAIDIDAYLKSGDIDLDAYIEEMKGKDLSYAVD